MREIDVKELSGLLQQENHPPLIDVREPHETAAGKLEGEGIYHIPMGEISRHYDEFASAPTVMVICRSGGRSAKVAQLLEQQGVVDVVNVKGGMLAWHDEVDDSIDVV